MSNSSQLLISYPDESDQPTIVQAKANKNMGIMKLSDHLIAKDEHIVF
jgi:hypothetical protein